MMNLMRRQVIGRMISNRGNIRMSSRASRTYSSADYPITAHLSFGVVYSRDPAATVIN